MVFQASPSTQLPGEAERDGAAGTGSLPAHHTRTPHESKAVYQGTCRSSVPVRLGYCWPVFPFSLSTETGSSVGPVVTE
jgi:hypothetical protein